VRRTKILATVGPASASPARLASLLAAGADAFRLNFSHGTEVEHRRTLAGLHAAVRRVRREVAIVGDVPGPKMRIGDLAGGSVRLEEGHRWILDSSSQPGGPDRVGVQLPTFRGAAVAGDPVLLGDGDVELVVERTGSRSLLARVRNGGEVRSHAGVFLPRARLRATVFGAKDRAHARVGLEGGIDYLALSFVHDARDVVGARRWLDRHGGREVGVIAKIERAAALETIDGILAASDGIMVARGDLGIEVPLERMALEQKELVEKANLAGKVVIVATQMLLSMVNSPRPTRAEATDVANAVLDGADAVMLSEESAVGRYPVEAVRWLDRIASVTELALGPGPVRTRLVRDRLGAERVVAGAAVELAEGVGARAIVTPTHSGRTARWVASLRPRCPVVALSSSDATRRRLALVGGVIARPAPGHQTLSELRERSRACVAELGLAGPEPIVLTAGWPVEGRPTNLVTLVEAVEARQTP